jgi:23S rRNA (cytidine2498-2'-O)-methyltransferase
MNLLLVKPGAESFAAAEGGRLNLSMHTEAPGIVATQQPIPDSTPFCFPFWILLNATRVPASPGIRDVELLGNWFCEHIRNKRIDKRWFLFWLTCGENGFTPVSSKQERLKETLKKRISRISKLSDSSYPPADTPVRGLFIAEDAATGIFYVATKALFCGQRRMKDEPEAPSRSFLKVEEALTIFGNAPLRGNCVVDLGAAPGGWTWAAIKRGATVFAIDNGPLKGGPLDHPHVHHFRNDAFVWKPENITVDWLFCDMVEKPLVVMERIRTWFSKKWCKYAVINFKYGYSDPSHLIEQLQGSKGIRPLTETMLCRHLFHDRDEITVMAKVKVF